jgi:hypothetical protein
MFSYIPFLFTIVELAHAAATGRDITSTAAQAFTTLSQAQVESFKPYSLYAAAAYCQPSQTLSWSCGGPSVYSVVLCLSEDFRG